MLTFSRKEYIFYRGYFIKKNNLIARKRLKGAFLLPNYGYTEYAYRVAHVKSGK